MPLLPVDTAVAVEVGPIIDRDDFATLETAVAYNAPGMSVDLIKNSATAITKIDITPTTGGGDNDWTHKGNGVYELNLTAGQNDTEGSLRVVGIADGVLVFESPVYTVLPQAVYDSLVAGSDTLQVDTVQVEGADATDRLEAAAASAQATGAVADAVWDEARSGHNAAGSFGEAVHKAKAALVNTRQHAVATGIDTIKDDDGETTLVTLTPSEENGVITVTPS